MPYYIEDPNRDHTFDNHPHDCSCCCLSVSLSAPPSLGFCLIQRLELASYSQEWQPDCSPEAGQCTVMVATHILLASRSRCNGTAAPRCGAWSVVWRLENPGYQGDRSSLARDMLGFMNRDLGLERLSWLSEDPVACMGPGPGPAITCRVGTSIGSYRNMIKTDLVETGSFFYEVIAVFSHLSRFHELLRP